MGMPCMEVGIWLGFYESGGKSMYGMWTKANTIVGDSKCLVGSNEANDGFCQ